MKARVLVVDDDQAMCSLVEAGLARYEFEVAWKTRADEAFESMSESDFDVVVTDLNMRGMSGLELCERIVANRPDIPVIVITAFGSLDTAVAAIRAGAYDFLTKPFEMQALRIALERGVQHRKLRDEVAEGVAKLRASRGIVPGLTVVLVGDDPASAVYVRNKEKAATEAGMVSTIERLPASAVACGRVTPRLFDLLAVAVGPRPERDGLVARVSDAYVERLLAPEGRAGGGVHVEDARRGSAVRGRRCREKRHEEKEKKEAWPPEG